MDRKRYETNFKYGEEVVGPSGVRGAFDEKAVDSPFVFWHMGKYYMLYIGFDGQGYQTALAVSDDLWNWEKEVVLFPRNNTAEWDGGGIAGNWILRENDMHEVPKLKKVDGKYWMVYHSYPDAGYEAGPAQIGLAYTEDETLHNWTRSNRPILSWMDGALWERGGLYKGCLVEDGGLYYLFYNAKDQREWIWREQIGIAVSENLSDWKRLEGNPVIQNTCNGWDSCFCADPCVVRDGDMWIMYYYGYDGQHAQEGIAYSRDLLHWEKEPEPILACGGQGQLDELHAHKPSVVEKDGCLYHFYCAVRPSREEDRIWNQDPTQLEEDGRGEYRCISVATNRQSIIGNN